MMRSLIIILTTIFSLAAAADCSVDPNCVMKSDGAGYAKQGPGCADCLKFLNKKRLRQAGPGAFDSVGGTTPQDQDDSTKTEN